MPSPYDPTYRDPNDYSGSYSTSPPQPSPTPAQLGWQTVTPTMPQSYVNPGFWGGLGQQAVSGLSQMGSDIAGLGGNFLTAMNPFAPMPEQARASHEVTGALAGGFLPFVTGGYTGEGLPEGPYPVAPTGPITREIPAAERADAVAPAATPRLPPPEPTTPTPETPQAPAPPRSLDDMSVQDLTDAYNRGEITRAQYQQAYRQKAFGYGDRIPPRRSDEQPRQPSPPQTPAQRPGNLRDMIRDQWVKNYGSNHPITPGLFTMSDDYLVRYLQRLRQLEGTPEAAEVRRRADEAVRRGAGRGQPPPQQPPGQPTQPRPSDVPRRNPLARYSEPELAQKYRDGTISEKEYQDEIRRRISLSRDQRQREQREVDPLREQLARMSGVTPDQIQNPMATGQAMVNRLYQVLQRHNFPPAETQMWRSFALQYGLRWPGAPDVGIGPQ